MDCHMIKLALCYFRRYAYSVIARFCSMWYCWWCDLVEIPHINSPRSPSGSPQAAFIYEVLKKPYSFTDCLRYLHSRTLIPNLAALKKIGNILYLTRLISSSLLLPPFYFCPHFPLQDCCTFPGKSEEASELLLYRNRKAPAGYISMGFMP